MSDAWYYADRGQRVGPVPLQQLRDVVARLPNARDTFVWRDGFPDWKKAGDVPELWSQGAAPPPPPATRTPEWQQPQQHAQAGGRPPFVQTWFGFAGRANRAKYWLVALTNIGILIVLAFLLLSTLPSTAAFVLLGLVYIVFFISILAISAKRLHDRNKPTWWLLVFVVLPIALGILAALMGDTGGLGIILGLAQLGLGIWALVELGCLRGTVGANDYGEDPLQRPSQVR